MATLPGIHNRLARNLDRARDKVRELEIEAVLKDETIRRLRADLDGAHDANVLMHRDKARALQAVESLRADNARLRRELGEA